MALSAQLSQVREGSKDFAAVDLDPGAATHPGEYDLCDESYRELLRRLQKNKFAHIDAALQRDLLRYFADFKPKLRNAKDSRRWADDEAALNQLKAAALPPQPAAAARWRFDSARKAQ